MTRKNYKYVFTKKEPDTRSNTISVETPVETPEENLFKCSNIDSSKNDKIKNKALSYINDWNKLIRDIFRVTLDPKQQAVVYSTQVNRKTAVKSGHARGKDFIVACVSLAHLCTKIPSKTVLTAPTGRQVISIMMAELKQLHNQANEFLAQFGTSLGTEIQAKKICFPDDKRPTHFLEGFKSNDKDTEAWTGYHSPNILVCVTEASGIEQETFDAIEGLLTGDSHLLSVGNPNSLVGEFYQSFKKKSGYSRFTLSCLNAPNVVANKILIPGQVDANWVDSLITKKRGWVTRIAPKNKSKKFNDFEWRGKTYRPGTLFKIKAMGIFPTQTSNNLVPLEWLELANENYKQIEEPELYKKTPGRLGCDIAGMGADDTVLYERHSDVVLPPNIWTHLDTMQVTSKIRLQMTDLVHNITMPSFIDTIGLGAGVCDRLQELGLPAYSVKFSENAKYLYDVTGEREFLNMRAFCLWALRDFMNPDLNPNCCIPFNEELEQELVEITYELMSNGKIKIEPKEDIKKRIGRSPDYSDSLSMTFYPAKRMKKLDSSNIKQGLIGELRVGGM